MKIIIFLIIVTTIFSCKNANINYNVTEEEAKSFAKKIAEGIADMQPQVFDNAINGVAFSQKIGKKEITPKEITSFLKSAGLGTKISNEAKSGSYELVKIFEKNKKRYVLFRLSGTNGINYHELELCKDKNVVQIADIFIYMTGEAFSTTVSNLYKTMKDGSSGDASEFHLTSTLPKIKKLIEEAKYDEALEKYNTLPANIKKNKTIMMYKVLITQNINDSIYNNAINEYKSSGAENNAMLDFLLIDGYIISKKYDKALEAVNSLDKYINKDPYLDFFRYNIIRQQGNEAKAIPYLEAAAKSMPNSEDIQIELIYIYKEQNKKDALKELVDKYKANKKFNQQTLTTILEY